MDKHLYIYYRQLLGLLLFLAVLPLAAQKRLVNIDIGQQVPDVRIDNIEGGPYRSASLSELSQNKLLIIDFWATTCRPCLLAMPRLDSLQREYADKLNLLSVTGQEEAHVKEFFKARQANGYYVPQMPKVYGDSLLQGLFPHNTVPLYVWIKQGKVYAFTNKLNREQLELALAGKPLSLPTKIDFVKANYTRSKTPLLAFLAKGGEVEGLKLMDNYSLLTDFIPEVGYSGGFSIVFDSLDANKVRLTATNVILQNLYKQAYGKGGAFFNEPVVKVLSKDSLFMNPKQLDVKGYPFIEKTAFCYEGMSNRGFDHLCKRMQEDLRYGFPQFEVLVEQATDSCLVLEKFNDDIEQYVSADQDRKGTTRYADGCEYNENYSLSTFRTFLELFVFRESKYAIVDQTGFAKRFDMELCGGISGVEDVNRLMQPYGIRLVKKVATFDQLVIRDRKADK